MCRLLLINFFVLLFLAGPAKAAGQSTDISPVTGGHSKPYPCVIAEQNATTDSKSTIGMIEREGKTIKYYGALEVEAFRLVAIKKTEQIVWAPVWGGHIYSRACPIELLLRSRRP